MGQVVNSCDVERASPCTQMEKSMTSSCVGMPDDFAGEGFTEELVVRPNGKSKGSKKPLMVGQKRSSGDSVTRLMAAAQYGSVDGIRRICEAGDSLESQDVRGWTALHYAAHGLQYDAYVALLKYGANPKQKSYMGLTPYEVAHAVDPQQAERLKLAGERTGVPGRRIVIPHCHHAALAYDVGVYFEANGHGTLLFSKKLVDRMQSAAPREVMSDQVSQSLGDPPKLQQNQSVL
eukprot:s663_g6.t1